MSQTMQVPPMDPYLAQQTAPVQQLILDENFGSIRMVTPIGRLSYVNLVKPKSVKQPDGSMGAPIFSATLLLNPNTCADIYRAIVMVASNRFPPETRPNPQNPNEMLQMTAEQMLAIPSQMGGLHYPLRPGDNNYMREPKKYEQWRGLLFLNTSVPATDSNGNSTQPICKDESGHTCDASKLYSGCYGRMHLTFFAYPKPGAQTRGSRGVGVRLMAVQFARHGEKMGGFDAEKASADAFAQAGVIPVDPQQVGYGPNTMTPGSIPPGVGVPFAPPPGGGFAQPQPVPVGGGFAQPQPVPVGGGFAQPQPMYPSQPQSVPAGFAQQAGYPSPTGRPPGV